MSRQTDRVILNYKDISLIAGVHPKTGQRLLRKIRKQFNKPPRSFVSVSEFCEYMKMKESDVTAWLNS